MRLAVYIDYVHRAEHGRVYAPRAFALFVAGLRRHCERLTVAGRVDPEPGRSHYPLPDDVRFVALPHYASATSPVGLARSLAGGLRRWSSALTDADVVWVLGPQGLALPLALLAVARGKRVVLGVRQELPAYARSRHPGRRPIHGAADLLDAAYRGLARRLPVIVVGPALARRYRRARALLALTVSLIPERDLDAAPPPRAWDGDEWRVLSVGRLEEEKNPQLLADVLAGLRAADPADLRGYVAHDDGLREAYRDAHVFLHVSWTEGLPQVLFEAFAARLPVVATAVGSVPDAGGDAVLLVPPGDPVAPVDRLLALAADARLRAALSDAGLERARAHSLETEL